MNFDNKYNNELDKVNIKGEIRVYRYYKTLQSLIMYSILKA